MKRARIVCPHCGAENTGFNRDDCVKCGLSVSVAMMKPESEILTRLVAELRDALLVFQELESACPGQFRDRIGRIQEVIRLMGEDPDSVPVLRARL